MAFSTLDGLRTGRLNDALGLDSDSDNRFGSTGVRNLALQDGARRLWPEMGRLTSETITITDSTIDYTLTTLRQVERIELTDASRPEWYSDAGKDFSTWYDEEDATPVVRLRLPQPFNTALTLKAIGYVPYTVPASGGSSFDIQPDDEWIVVEGAISFLYRRQMNSFATYERHENENRKTSLSVQEMMAMYREAEARYQQAKISHRRRMVAPVRAVRIRQ